MIIADSSRGYRKGAVSRPTDVAQVRIVDGRAAVQRFCLSVMRVSAILPCRTYDRLWREAMEGIVSVSMVEDPQSTGTQKVKASSHRSGETII